MTEPHTIERLEEVDRFLDRLRSVLYDAQSCFDKPPCEMDCDIDDFGNGHPCECDEWVDLVTHDCTIGQVRRLLEVLENNHVPNV